MFVFEGGKCIWFQIMFGFKSCLVSKVENVFGFKSCLVSKVENVFGFKSSLVSFEIPSAVSSS